MDYLEKWLIFYNEAKNLALLTIAKNCSESILQGVTKDFVYFDTIDLPKDTTAIVIFRDPYDRWISGTVEYFAYPDSLRDLSISEPSRSTSEYPSAYLILSAFYSIIKHISYKDHNIHQKKIK